MHTEMPFEYGGAALAPLLDPETDALYLALRESASSRADPHILAGELALIAERLECDHQAARLTRHGVECRAGYGDRRDGDLHCVAACVTVYWRDDAAPGYKDHLASVNAAAAARLADRLDSGLEVREAIGRMLAQCTREELSETSLRTLEQDALRWTRRLQQIDAQYTGRPHDDHQAAIDQASREMP